ncbi:hypothetical protein GE107_06635 [Cohnella sp. CFH 77786]|uniref:hypothetical protein n=1 Tax=Cohnella sp. CFH 77786 TaxID=2662265 RepID=UPI001C608C07|nr:hypothetical protein [Cohnella sp. CFH 77786]MBW5445741.1 hypothetical protein [Cohnella sp. CFH 77786]
MNDPNLPSIQGWNKPQGFGGEMYPGLGDPFAGPPAFANPKVLPGPGNAKPGFLSNLAEWKLMLDRLGGIDGVLTTMGKLQKIVTTMQQMAPLLRLFIGKGAAVKAADASGGARRNRKSRRKKRSRRPSGQKR